MDEKNPCNEINNTSSSGGFWFTSMLTVLFIGLKLTGYINWSWWWVLSPLWITLLVVLFTIAVVKAWVWYVNLSGKEKQDG